jgi:N-acetylmuramoyl-L-alanine amidase
MAFLRLGNAAWRTVGAVLVLAAGALAFQEPAEPLAVSAVRYWSLDEATRIVIEVSGEFEYRSDRLSNPDRLYFDIPGSKPSFIKERTHTIPVGDSLLKQLRVSETRPNVTRVVLDLECPVDFTASLLANPDRLVVEVRRKLVTAPANPTASPAQAPISVAPSAPPVKTVPQPAAPAPASEPVPLPAKRGQTGSSSLVRALGLKLGRVVLDPGHGGSDTGTISRSGLMEKDLVLDVALRLGTLIDEKLGAEIVYTRKDDSSVPLEARTALANEKEADLFLSIHANSGVASASGAETYYLNFTTSKAALDVAARENASSQRSIHELQDLIEKIALKDKIDESREFAARIQTVMYRDMARVNSQIKDRGVRRAPFVVLIGAAMPSVLCEIAFMSNPREEKLLSQPDYRQKLAEALYKGVSQYASTLSRFQVAERKSP